MIISRIKLFFFLIILLAIIILGISATPICQIQQISCSGQSYYSETEITQYVNYIVGQNLLQGMNYNPIDLVKLSFGQPEKQIKQLLYIKDVKVKYKPLHGVVVEVVERTPISLIEMTSRHLLVDEDGVVLEDNSDESSPVTNGNTGKYVLIKGINPPNYTIGKPLPGEVINTYENVASIIEAFKTYDAAKGTKHTEEISFIDASNPDNIIINYNNTIDIYFSSNTDFVYKAGFISKMIDDNLIGHEKGKLIYNESKGSFSFIPS
jgi:hypothetical protein